MTIRILTAALVLALMRVAGADADEPGGGMSISAPPLGAVRPAVTIQVTQTPEPSGTASPGVRAEPGSEPLLTLDEAVALALKDNRGVRTATLEVGRAGDRIGAAKTRRFPSIHVGAGGDYPLAPINMTFNQGDFGTYPGIGPVPATNTTLSTQNLMVTASAAIVQPLARQYRLGLTVDQLGVAQDIAREDLRTQQQAVVNDVKRAYYLVLQAQSAREAVQEAVRSLRELDRVVTAQLAERKALKADSLDVKTRLAQAETDAFAASNDLATRKEQLNHIMGREPNVPFRVSPVPDATPFETDLDAAQTQAIRQRPELTRSELQVRFADYDLRIKKSEFIPDVDLVFRYLHPITSDRLPQNITIAGIEMTWELFDWGRKRQEAAEREKAMQQAQTTSAELRSRITIEVNTRYRKLEEAKSRLRVSELGLEAARERLQVTTKRYAERTALLADVLQSQAGVASANDQYQVALLGFWTARADFERALGGEQK
ncbi:MAG TPA: TolC family protein [Candidatus Bathyarchaeia archaeon]|nr:TolC family protein [Candidatus Bathyarchaeia archaeon]